MHIPSNRQADFQVVFIDDVYEPVAPDRVIALEVAPVHAPELDATYSWIFLSDALYVLYSKGLSGHAGHDL